MLAMTVLPLVIFADDISLIRIEGGLFQDFAPSAYHMQHVLFPILKKMGIDLQLRIIRPGYVPTGEGIIELKVHPVKSHIDSISLTNQGKLMKIRGYALSSHLKPQRVSERMANSALKYLKDLSEDIHIETCYDETAKQKGAALAIFAYTDTGCILGSDLAGAPGRTSEEIGKKVALELIKDIKTNATVDRYLADQLILYAGLAKGKTEYFIPFMTEHIESNLWLIQEILGAKVYLDNLKLTIEGIGYKHS
jgi:RNA 3'-terminal phosphate cyclase (ATP)